MNDSCPYPDKEHDRMCRAIGVSQETLCRALRQVGPKALNPALAKKWDPERPCDQFCYRVCETVVRARKVPEGFKLHVKRNSEGSHYFFRHRETGEIVDPTACQFGEEGYVYDGSKGASLMPKPSKGALMIAKELGWTFAG